MIADPAATNEPGFRNELLAVLSKEDVERLRSRLQRVKLISGQVLHEPGEHLDHVYFPEEGVVCLTADTRDAGIVEVGMTGRDGMIGVSVMLNPDPTAVHRALVQVPGIATRMQTN